MVSQTDAFQIGRTGTVDDLRGYRKTAAGAGDHEIVGGLAAGRRVLPVDLAVIAERQRRVEDRNGRHRVSRWSG